MEALEDILLGHEDPMLERGGVEAFFETLVALDKASRPDKEDLNGRPQAARQAPTGEPITFSRVASGSRKKRSGA